MNAIAKRERISSLYPVASTDDPVLKIVNVMAEEGVIGAVLQKPDLYPALSEILQPGDFYILSNGFIWHAFDQLSGRGEGIDLLTVYSELDKMKNPLPGDEIMGKLVGMIEKAPDAKNAEYYAREIFNTAMRIRVMRAAGKMIESALDRTVPMDTLIDGCDNELYKATNRHMDARTDALSIVNDYYEKMEHVANGGRTPGFLTGYPALDELLPSGLSPNEVTVLVGSEGMGKTTFLLSLARNGLVKGKRVGIFSLEMKQSEVVHNFMAMETGIFKSDLKTFNLNDAQRKLFAKSAGDIAKWPLDVVDEYPALTPVQLRRKLRKMWLTNPLELLIIDGLWLMEASEPTKNDRPRDVFNIMRDLVQISRDFNVPILLAHQYNAMVYKSQRPQLDHISESAGVRRNAQVIIGLHRQSYYTPDEGDDNTTWAHIMKDRNGRAQGQKVPFVYNNNFSRYEGGQNNVSLNE